MDASTKAVAQHAWLSAYWPFLVTPVQQAVCWKQVGRGWSSNCGSHAGQMFCNGVLFFNLPGLPSNTYPGVRERLSVPAPNVVQWKVLQDMHKQKSNHSASRQLVTFVVGGSISVLASLLPCLFRAAKLFTYQKISIAFFLKMPFK